MSRWKPEPKPAPPKAKPKRYEVGYKLAPRKMRRAKYFAERGKHLTFLGGPTPWNRSSAQRMHVEYRKVKTG